MTRRAWAAAGALLALGSVACLAAAVACTLQGIWTPVADRADNFADTALVFFMLTLGFAFASFLTFMTLSENRKGVTS